ncbi:MAG: T9SS type A sorting domain-containing protein [Paludibacter sp.]|nr:T9SS type A sorting domain-containing protein [Paludibacter sp.]
MKTITKFFFIGFMLLLSFGVTAQTDLLSNATEDGDFSEYLTTENQIWPPKPGAGYWDADGVKGGTRTALRVHFTDDPLLTWNYHSKYHYIQVLMDNGTLGCNYIWRKLSGLTPGETYTFCFYYRMTHTLAERSVNFAITDAVTNIKVNKNADGNNIIDGQLGSTMLELASTANTTYNRATYTFTVPNGKTEVFATWMRNKTIAATPTETMRIFLDDMSLYVGTTTSTPNQQKNSLLNVFPNPVKDYISFNSQGGIQRVIIMDMLGKILIDTPIRVDNKVDVSSLPQGNYLIKCIGSETKTLRFIKAN